MKELAYSIKFYAFYAAAVNIISKLELALEHLEPMCLMRVILLFLGSALYFVQVEHTVPRDLFIGNGWIAEAILDPDDSGNVIYSIVPQIMACPALAIDENNGNVTFEVQPHQG